MDKLIDEADRLCERLLEIRAEWRRWPVMYARLVRLSRMAEWRHARRVRAKRMQAELLLLRELRTDVERWSEGGGDVRDLGYILETAAKLEEQFPKEGE